MTDIVMRIYPTVDWNLFAGTINRALKQIDPHMMQELSAV